MVCRFGIRHASSTISSNPTSHTFLLLACTVSCSVKPCGKRARSGRASRGRAAPRTLWPVVHPAPARLADGRSSALRPGVQFAGSNSTRLRLPGSGGPSNYPPARYERQVSPSPAEVDPPPAEVFKRRCADESVELLVYRLPGAVHIPLFQVFPVGSDEAEVEVEVVVAQIIESPPASLGVALGDRYPPLDQVQIAHIGDATFRQGTRSK